MIRFEDGLAQERARIDRRFRGGLLRAIDRSLRDEVRVGALAGLLEILPATASARLELASIRAASALGTVLLRAEPWVVGLPLDRGELVRGTRVGSAARGFALLPMDADGATHLVELDVVYLGLLVEGLIDVLPRRGQLRKDDHRADELGDIDLLRFKLVKARDEVIDSGGVELWTL